MKQLRAGVASVNITPPLGLEMSGYGFGKSRGILDELCAQALILDNGEERVVLITTDLIGLSRQYVNSVRETVEAKIGVKRDHILICGSHTHSGPATMYLRQWGEVDRDYIRCCEKKLIGAAVWASEGLAPAKVGFGRGFIDSISYNRIWKGGPIDPEVGVMRIDRENGDMSAVFMNFSCHPVNLHSYGNLISADFPGYARRLIEKAKGGVSVLYTNGAGGDINPVGDTSNIAYAERNGIILGCEALKVAEQIRTMPKADLWAKTKNVKVPLGKLPSKRALEKTHQRRVSELKRMMRNRRSYQDDMHYNIDVQNAKLDIEWAEDALREIERGQPERYAFVELQAIGINDLVLVGIPGEVYVDIGLGIKRNSRHGYTSIIGYANGCLGYFPTREAYKIRAYETAIRKVYGIYPFKPDVGEIIIDAAKELING
jgi:hypothetical protein